MRLGPTDLIVIFGIIYMLPVIYIQAAMKLKLTYNKKKALDILSCRYYIYTNEPVQESILPIK